MGFLSAIAAGAKALFGISNTKTQDNVMEVARGVGGWIDGLNYTDQEKAEAQAKVSESLIEFLKSTVGENTERSVTRRIIAMWIIRCEMTLIMGGAVTWLFDKDWSIFLFKVASFDTPMGWAFMTVLIFFFGNYALRVFQGRS